MSGDETKARGRRRAEIERAFVDEVDRANGSATSLADRGLSLAAYLRRCALLLDEDLCIDSVEEKQLGQVIERAEAGYYGKRQGGRHIDAVKILGVLESLKDSPPSKAELLYLTPAGRTVHEVGMDLFKRALDVWSKPLRKGPQKNGREKVWAEVTKALGIRGFSLSQAQRDLKQHRALGEDPTP